jgi:deoxyribonuclease-4
LASIGRDDRVGVCFDTAHAFIAGYPLVGTDGYDEVLGILDREVGLHRVRAVHLNDAKTALGSRNDRHEAAGSGHMGSEVFARLVQDPRFFEIPVVLEVPDRDGASETALRWLRPLRDAARTAHNRMLREHHIVGPEPVIA